MHFCYLLFYIVFILNSFVTTFATLGLLIQDAIEDDSLGVKPYNPFNEGLTGFYTVLLVMFFVFYPLATYVSFQAYKEFKAMIYDSGMRGMNIMAPPRQGGGER
jgi:ABC-type Fe3+ transport system permease subunit